MTTDGIDKDAVLAMVKDKVAYCCGGIYENATCSFSFRNYERKSENKVPYFIATK
jgi:hypothetical protein